MTETDRPPSRQPGDHTTTTPPVPAPPGGDGRDLADALHQLADVDPHDLDAVIAAAEEAHRRLRDRLGHAGGR